MKYTVYPFHHFTVSYSIPAEGLEFFERRKALFLFVFSEACLQSIMSSALHAKACLQVSVSPSLLVFKGLRFPVSLVLRFTEGG